jgi:hypothetical protein
MYWGKNRWCKANNAVDPDEGNVTKPTYFEEAYFAGLATSPTAAQSRYGRLVPLVLLYKINYPEELGRNELFPKVSDQHKPNKPLVPNGLRRNIRKFNMVQTRHQGQASFFAGLARVGPPFRSAQEMAWTG